MEILLRNAEGNLSQSDRDYAAEKLGKLDHYFHQAQKVEIVHRERRLAHHPSHCIEVTVMADGYMIRSEEHDESLRAAIDKVSDKLENRLRRLKGRIITSHRKRNIKAAEKLSALVQNEMPMDEEPVKIKERKSFHMKPISYEEAALQMEMVDHPFFVFHCEESGRLEVLYKRKDGHYGLIQPLEA